MRNKATDLIERIFNSDDMDSLGMKQQANVYCLLAIASAIVYVGDQISEEISVRTRVQSPV